MEELELELQTTFNESTIEELNEDGLSEHEFDTIVEVEDEDENN